METCDRNLKKKKRQGSKILNYPASDGKQNTWPAFEQHLVEGEQLITLLEIGGGGGERATNYS